MSRFTEQEVEITVGPVTAWVRQTKSLGAEIDLSDRGIHDVIVIPENRMVAYADVFDLLSKVLGAWQRGGKEQTDG